MTLRNQLVLRAPAVADDAGTTTTTEDSRPKSMAGWMAGIKEMTAPPAPDKAKAENNDGKETKTDAGANGGAAPPVDAGTVPPAKPDADKAGASAAPKDEKPPAAGAATTTEDDDERPPRTSADWKARRAKVKQREDALNREIESRDTQLKELQGKLTEFESKLSQPTEPPPEIKSELDRLAAQNKELSDRIMVLDVTQHPDFQTYFENKRANAIGKAKRIVGEAQAAEVEKILAMPDSEYKSNQLETLLSEMTDMQRSRMAVVVDELENAELERKAEITKATTHAEKLKTEREAKAKQRQEAFEKAKQNGFTEVLNMFQDPDPKKGFMLYQKKPDGQEGAKEWNAAVDKRIADAKSLLFGGNMTPQKVSEAALRAVAMPAILEAYQHDLKEWTDKISKLEAQVKTLSAAQPAQGGAGGTKSSDDDKVPEGMSSEARVARWTKRVVQGP